MRSKYKNYEHHGVWVWVRKDLKGQHRKYCLCWSCMFFKPEKREENCKIANLLYAVDVMCGITTPVFECPDFMECGG